MQNFDCFNPDLNDFPVIFSLPHSGTLVPDDITESLNKDVPLSNTDWFLKELYSFLPEMGFTVIQNNINRYVADPNRQNFESSLDNNYRHNVVYQENTFGHSLYAEPLSKETIEQRINDFYLPYHAAIESLIRKKLEIFEDIYLIDLHSFFYYPRFEKMSPADFVIGNDYDNTSSKAERLWLTNKLFEHNYTVSDNFPFTGGKITKHYGKNPHINSMQIEIRYNKYIEDRDFIEEELTGFNEDLFNDAQENLKLLVQDFQDKIAIPKNTPTN